jgi:hypothetical protein
VPIALVLLLYIAVRLLLFFSVNHIGYTYVADAAQYYSYAHCSITSACLYFNRPFLFPLFIKLTAYHYLAMCICQCLISTFAWFFLAYSISSAMKTPSIKWICLYFILIYSCSAYIIFWDDKALTESLSTSFLCVFFGCYIKALETRFSKAYLMGLIISGFILVNLRDANIYIVILFALGSLALSYTKFLIAPKKAAYIVLIAIFSIGLWGSWTANKGQRWLEPLCDLFAYRVIHQPDMIQYYSDHGMPAEITAEVRPFADTMTAHDLIINNPNPAVKDWFIKQGKPVYLQYLLSHPSAIYSMYFEQEYWVDLVGAQYLFYEYAFYGYPFYPPSSQAMLINHSNIFSQLVNSLSLPSLMLLLIIGGVCYVDNFSQIRKDPLIILSQIVIIMTIVFLAGMVWLSEPMENMRHQLNNHLLIVFSIMLFSFKSLDYSNLNKSLKKLL